MPRTMLHPTVYVVAKDGASGSGTIIFSQRLKSRSSQKRPDGSVRRSTRHVPHTYVLTNWHVVDSNMLITYRKKRRMHRGAHVGATRIRGEVKHMALKVHVFEFGDKVSNLRKHKYIADIVACDKERDLALLRLRTGRIFSYVAPLSRKRVMLVWDEPVKLLGCATDEPLIVEGRVGGMRKWASEKVSLIATVSNITTGDSGGGLYRYSASRKRYELIGVLSKGLGSVDPSSVTYSVPIRTVHEFIKKNGFGFMLDE